MKKILMIVAMLALSAFAVAQNAKKVAVWETETNSKGVSSLKMELVRSGLEEAVDYTPGYVKYDRAKFEDVLKEHMFQRSGAVKDDDVKRMGEYAGVQFVIVPQVEMDGMDFLIVARVINVETGESKTRKETCGTTSSEIDQACSKLASRLFGSTNGGTGANTQNSGNNSGGTTTQRGQDFTETAFGINMRMVYVEGGTFTMGCTSEQGGECENDEKPTRQTTVGSFYIGMLEVTQSQWEKVMGTSIYQQKSKAVGINTYGVGPEYPMYYVCWEEVKEFCARLSRQTGRTYRLPTEAEWEYAARGGKRGDGAKYSGGWSVDDVAWYYKNSGNSTHPCGTKRGNALGIYDMSGNVWEWCEDWYGTYLQYDNNNPRGASSGSDRVRRGGSWLNDALHCRVSNRSNSIPSNRGSNIGFRVVLVP